MRRKNNAIKPLPSYAFVVDGACESWYLNMLNMSHPEFCAHIVNKQFEMAILRR
jgi:hypothetical protein